MLAELPDAQFTRPVRTISGTLLFLIFTLRRRTCGIIICLQSTHEIHSKYREIQLHTRPEEEKKNVKNVYRRGDVFGYIYFYYTRRGRFDPGQKIDVKHIMASARLLQYDVIEHIGEETNCCSRLEETLFKYQTYRVSSYYQ